MNAPHNQDIEAWEGEGGAAPASPEPAGTPMAGTVAQVEWAQRIRRQVNDEFDRVAGAFRAIADRQKQYPRTDTEAIIAILEEKRTEVMCKQQAGYFIHDWQEISDQVRRMIFQDVRYQVIKRRRPAQERS